MKTLVIGAAIIDIIMKIKRLPKKRKVLREPFLT